jgi:acyl-CoA synthetase (AMP-forming)/AMP-acid ligase II
MTPATTPVSPVELHDRLLARLAATAKRDVLQALPGGERLGVADFERRVRDAGTAILRAGHGATRPGPGASELVLLSSRNLPSYLVALAALWRHGFVPLLADADLAAAEIGQLVAAFRPSLALLDRPADPPGGAVTDPGAPLAGLHLWIPARPAPVHREPGAAIVRLTSGTTGRPRGLRVTAAQLLTDAAQITSSMGIGPDDTMIAPIPLGHAYGFVHVIMALLYMGTRPLLLEQPLPSLLRTALTHPGPLVLPGTPYLFDMLLQGGPPQGGSALRLALSAGAPLPRRLSAAFRQRWGLPIRTFYGASECGGIAYDRSPRGVLPDGCVGTPLDGVRLSLGPGEGEPRGHGRIRIESAAVVDGCLPASADGALRPGLFLSSDLGRLDRTGRLHLVGRIDRLINVGGRKVNPTEVEEALRAVAGVHHAAVFGLPDRQRGERVCACVVAAKGVTREAILDASRRRLASFKLPRRIEFVAALPLTARGKTDRQALQRLLSVAPRPSGIQTS